MRRSRMPVEVVASVPAETFFNVVAVLDSGWYHQFAGVVIEIPDRLLDCVDFTLVEVRLTALTTDPSRHRIQYQMADRWDVDRVI